MSKKKFAVKQVESNVGLAGAMINPDDPIISQFMAELRQKVYEKNPKGRKFGTDVIKVHPFAYNFDNECRSDFLKEKAIRLTSVDSFDKKKNKIYEGLQSEFFGSDFGDDLAFSERYSCVCGKKVGQMYEHDICPDCNTEVQYLDVDLQKFGWVIIDGGFKVIQPLYYEKLESLLGKLDTVESVLGSIIKIHYKDDNGNKITNDPFAPAYDEKDKQNLPKHPFIRRGMTWLSEHLTEVLDYYKKQKPNKKDAFQEIYDNLDNVFCHCIPAYSAVLRMEAPGEKDEKSYKVKTNTCYRSIISTVNKINEIVADNGTNEYTPEEMTSIDRFCYQIQKDISDLFNEEFNIINGKEGYIQGKIVAGRYNFSARNIIISGSKALHSDEVEICYATAIELYRYELTAYYAKYHNCTLSEANDAIIQAQTTFNKDVYYTMMYMIKSTDCYLIVNRNPSINYGSFLALRVVNVKPDINDRTLTVNKRILIVMNADFDGDQENIFRTFGEHLNSKIARAMNPKYTLFIDKKNGQLNKALMPTKDEAIGFWIFNNI